MKTQYELSLQTWSHLNPDAEAERDYETIEFLPCDNYRDAVKQAKEISKKIPYIDRRGDKIVRVQVAAFYCGEEAEHEYETSYFLLWKETYRSGKRLPRYR